MRLSLIILWSILFLGQNNAQEEYINFDIWEVGTTKVGSQVLDIHQDQDGFIWLSTFNGVIRFDGSHFTHLTDIYPEYDQIPTGHISSVRVDPDKSIWIGTIEKGLFIIDNEGQLSSFNDGLSKRDSLAEYRITDIIFVDSLLMVVGRTGLSTYKHHNNSYSKVIDITGIPDSEIRSVLKYKNDLIFTSKTSIFSLKGSIREAQNTRLPQVFLDTKGLLWSSSIDIDEGTVISKYEGQNWNKHEDQPFTKFKKYRRFTWDYHGRLWGYVYSGDLVCYDFKQNNWIIQKESTNHNLDQVRIRDVLADNSGSVWIGSDVISLYRKRQDIRSIKIQIDKKDEIISFFFDKDRLLYSNNFDGLFTIDNKGEKKNFTKTNSELAADKYVKIFDLDSTDIGILSRRGFQILKDNSFSKLMPSSGSNRSLCFHEGYFWVGGVSKLLRIDPSTFECKVYKFESSNKFQNIYINGMVPKSKTELYLGANLKQLHIFDIEKEEFFPVVNDDPKIKPPTNCNHLSISDRNILAIAGTSGLYTYNGDKYKLHVPKKFFKSVIWYNDSLLLANTKDEIYKINISKDNISVLTQDNGLLNSQFSLRSVVKHNGEICFGGNKGLDCILPDTPMDTLSTILNLESLIVDNSIKINTQGDKQKIILPQSTRHIALKLNQFYTKNQRSARILYKNIDDSGWQELENNMLILNNPRSGIHEFQFKSSISNYAGKNKHIEVSFEIPVPWYKHFLFWLLCSIGAIISISWFIIQYQNKQKEKQLQEIQLKADIAELKLQALSGQMNPHFTFNALNSILQMINEQDAENAAIYVQRFSRMLRFVLEYSDQSWVALEEEIKFLEDYLQLEKMRFNDSFNYKIRINNPNKVQSSMIPPFFLQPKIENALKHGIRGLDDGGEIIIDIKIKEDTICASVTDNGIGRMAAKSKSQFQNPSTNKGIELTQKRLEQLNKLGYKATLEIIDFEESGTPTGTQIILILPLKKAKIQI